MKLKQTYNWTRLQLFFGIGIILREVLMVVVLLFLMTMVTYHMFPAGWFKAVINQIKECRAAYSKAFIDAFSKKVEARLMRVK